MSSEPLRIALRIEEPGKDVELVEFEDKKMIKIGRGSRKGIDVQLEDKAVARMHAVIHVRKVDDIFVMDMGSAGGTFIDGKKSGAKGKVASKSEILVGETKITVFVNDDIPEPQPLSLPPLDPSLAEGGMLPPPLPPLEAGGSGAAPVVSSAPDAPEGPPTTFNLTTPYNPEFVLHPAHQTPSLGFGVLSPAPSAFPTQRSEMGSHLLQEVVDRLGRQQWYREEKVW